MADIASVMLSGRLGQDPNVRYTQSGTAVCTGSIAVEHIPGKGEKEVSFFDFVVFGKNGETFAENTKKGQRVALSGRLRQRSWTIEGVKRTKVEIVADAVFTTGGQGSAEASSSA